MCAKGCEEGQMDGGVLVVVGGVGTRTYGLSPVCALIWISKCVFWKNAFRQLPIWHSYRFFGSSAPLPPSPLPPSPATAPPPPLALLRASASVLASTPLSRPPSPPALALLPRLSPPRLLVAFPWIARISASTSVLAAVSPPSAAATAVVVVVAPALCGCACGYSGAADFCCHPEALTPAEGDLV